MILKEKDRLIGFTFLSGIKTQSQTREFNAVPKSTVQFSESFLLTWKKIKIFFF